MVAVTALLVVNNALSRPPSVGQPPDPSVGGPRGPYPAASSEGLRLLAAAAGAVVVGALARAVLRRLQFGYEYQRDAEPRQVLEARLVRGPAHLTVDHEGLAEPSVILQVRRHYDAGTITLAEVPR